MVWFNTADISRFLSALSAASGHVWSPRTTVNSYLVKNADPQLTLTSDLPSFRGREFPHGDQYHSISEAVHTFPPACQKQAEPHEKKSVSKKWEFCAKKK